MYSLFKMGIFYCHVSLREGSSKTKPKEKRFEVKHIINIDVQKRVGDQNKRLVRLDLFKVMSVLHDVHFFHYGIQHYLVQK